MLSILPTHGLQPIRLSAHLHNRCEPLLCRLDLRFQKIERRPFLLDSFAAMHGQFRQPFAEFQTGGDAEQVRSGHMDVRTR